MTTKQQSLVVGAGNSVANNLIKLLIAARGDVKVIALQEKEAKFMEGIPVEIVVSAKFSIDMQKMIMESDVIYWVAGREFRDILWDLLTASANLEDKRIIIVDYGKENCLQNDLEPMLFDRPALAGLSLIRTGYILGPGFFDPCEVEPALKLFHAAPDESNVYWSVFSDARDVSRACLSAGSRQVKDGIYDVGTIVREPSRIFEDIKRFIQLKAVAPFKKTITFPHCQKADSVSSQDWYRDTDALQAHLRFPFELIPIEVTIKDTLVYGSDFFDSDFGVPGLSVYGNTLT